MAGGAMSEFANGSVVSGLYVYPIKSCAGISLGAAELDERGIRHDRRWMLVDEDGKFVSQRTQPRLALVRVGIQEEHLALDAPGMPTLEVPLEPETEASMSAVVWGDVVEVATVGGDADAWFGEILGASCRLVYQPEESVRPVDAAYGRGGDHVGLADGFPLLLISEASLGDLNGRLDQPVPIDRFRPNIVVSGCGAFEEDEWRNVRVGDIGMRVVKPCARCKIPTVDQQTAATSKEPLRTLATFRKFGSKVHFGQNLVHNAPGTVSIGDAVKVIAGSDT